MSSIAVRDSEVFMDLRAVLASAVEIELIAGKIFCHFQQCFAHDREASDLFGKMSREEDEHAVVVQRQLDLIATMPEAFVVIDDTIRDRQQVLVIRMHGILKEVEECSHSIKKAVGICCELEEEIEDLHEQVIVNLTQTTGKLAFATVALEAIGLNAEHTEGLFSFARKLGVERLEC
tara:strand:- start:4243 stop:4773 length:531 start_codon:yes stop_codon:yes gene_type:complete